MRNLILGAVLASLLRAGPGLADPAPVVLPSPPGLPLACWSAWADALKPQIPDLAKPVQAPEIRFTHAPALALSGPVTITFLPTADGGLDGRLYRLKKETISRGLSLGQGFGTCPDGARPPATTRSAVWPSRNRRETCR